HHSLRFCLSEPATTDIYTLSLHDALPIYEKIGQRRQAWAAVLPIGQMGLSGEKCRGIWQGLSTEKLLGKCGVEFCGRSVPYGRLDRKSTRLNSSHVKISYAVFCLKKKKTT